MATHSAPSRSRRICGGFKCCDNTVEAPLSNCAATDCVNCLSLAVGNANCSSSASAGCEGIESRTSNDCGRPDFHFREFLSNLTQKFPSTSASIGPTF